MTCPLSGQMQLWIVAVAKEEVKMNSVLNSVRKISTRGLFLLGTCLAPVAAVADNVTLTSQDRSVSISGELIGVVDNLYVVQTRLGEIRLSTERVSCEGPGCPTVEVADADITLAGAETVAVGLLPLLLEGYSASLDADPTTIINPQNDAFVTTLVGENGFGDELGVFEIKAATSGDGFSALLDQTADVALTDRRITPEEARALRDAGAGNMVSVDQESIVAIDSIVVVTHPDNPIRSLSTSQLAGIFTGRVTNWSQVGGPDREITIVESAGESSARSVLLDGLIGPNAVVSGNKVSANDISEVAQIVTNDEGAIGYTGLAFQRGAKPLTIVSECGLPMVPDAFSARTEEYAFQRRLYFYNRADGSNELTQQFKDFALSENADNVIAKAGFIDLGISRITQSPDSDRARNLAANQTDAFEAQTVQEMLGLMADYDRLSSTFRFRTGSTRLDERAITDLTRLTTYLEEQPTGTRVAVVGFTDDVGPFASNKTLAEGRAEQVRDELLGFAGNRIAGLEVDTVAFGEIAPAACNTTDRGRSINRRVEIWVSSPS
jgi:phosphate transport system substrate-binding protein